MIRKFWLENGLGDTYEFTEENSNIFLNDPQGLGFVKNIATERLGDTEYVTAMYYNMPSPSGELLFYNKREQGYQDYDEFIDFIMIEPLRLYYLPPNTLSPYYIECQIVQLDKSEYDEDGIMRCPISFVGTSMWLNSSETVISVDNTQEADGKYYELVRPYHYSGEALKNIVINVVGNLPADFELEVYGEVENPVLTAMKGDTIYGVIKLDGTFSSNDPTKPSIYINTNSASEQLILRQGDSVLANPLSYQDLSIADGIASLTFFKLVVGQSLISFTSANSSTYDGHIVLKWKDKRVSV